MKTNPQRSKKKRGFLLLEALMAFSIFGIAVTSIVVALHRTAELSQDVIHAQWIKQEAQNILKEVITTPRDANDFVRDDSVTIDEFTEASILVEPYEAEDQEGNLIDKLFTVSVTIYWDDNGTREEETFSTVHYAPMFNSKNGL